jgi:hypothetical protein
MTTKHAGHKNSCPRDSRDALDALDRPNTLGTDRTGATHHHSPYDDRVVVVAESGAIEDTFDTSDRRLAAYIAFVDERRGWETLHYAESFGEILSEALQA